MSYTRNQIIDIKKLHPNHLRPHLPATSHNRFPVVLLFNTRNKRIAMETPAARALSYAGYVNNTPPTRNSNNKM